MRAVLIAGDLFDGARVRARTVDALLAAIRRTPEVDYLYLPGNHDEAANAFCDCALPENLKVFGKTWSTVQYDGIAISGVQIGADAGSDYVTNLEMYILSFDAVKEGAEATAETGNA